MLVVIALSMVAAGADAGPASEAAATTPASARSEVLQEAVLSRAIFLVKRDACVLTEPDAPRARSFDFDASGNVSPVRAEVARCEAGSSLPAMVRALAAALVLGARDGRPAAALPAFDVALLDDAAFALVGKRLLRSRAPAVDPDPTAQTTQSYDGAALRALFDVLYVKPTEQRVGVSMQKLYDATVRDVVARLAGDIALLCARPKVLATESKRLLDGARTGKGPTGKDAWRMALNRLVAGDEDAARIDPRLVGFVLRRHADGTLSVVRDILRTVLADYDPATAGKLGTAL